MPLSSFGQSVELKITAGNGGCSYGVDNIGTYNSNFNRGDVVDQVNENPAGSFDYAELIDETKKYTYVVTELFKSTNISESVFSIFLPRNKLPTTTFHDATPGQAEHEGIIYICYPTPVDYDYNAPMITDGIVDYVCYRQN